MNTPPSRRPSTPPLNYTPPLRSPSLRSPSLHSYSPSLRHSPGPVSPFSPRVRGPKIGNIPLPNSPSLKGLDEGYYHYGYNYGEYERYGSGSSEALAGVGSDSRPELGSGTKRKRKGTIRGGSPIVQTVGSDDEDEDDEDSEAVGRRSIIEQEIIQVGRRFNASIESFLDDDGFPASTDSSAGPTPLPSPHPPTRNYIPSTTPWDHHDIISQISRLHMDEHGSNLEENDTALKLEGLRAVQRY